MPRGHFTGYCCPTPSAIANNARIIVPRPAWHMPIAVTLARSGGLTLKGYLHDISVGGIGMRFPSQVPPNTEPGERISNCVIELPSDEEISCEIEVRFMSVPIRGSGRMLGARFVRLSQTQQGAIARFVAALDREQQRKSHRDGY